MTVLGFPSVADSESITVTSGVLSTFVPDPHGARHRPPVRAGDHRPGRARQLRRRRDRQRGPSHRRAEPDHPRRGQRHLVAAPLGRRGQAADRRGPQPYRLPQQDPGPADRHRIGDPGAEWAPRQTQACAGNRTTAASASAVFGFRYSGFPQGLDVALGIVAPDGTPVTGRAARSCRTEPCPTAAAASRFPVAAADFGQATMPVGTYQLQLFAGPSLTPVGPAAAAVTAPTGAPRAISTGSWEGSHMSQQLDVQGEAREALGTAVASYGQRVLSDPHTLGNLVADLLPDLPRERSLLVTAAEAGDRGRDEAARRGAAHRPGHRGAAGGQGAVGTPGDRPGGRPVGGLGVRPGAGVPGPAVHRGRPAQAAATAGPGRSRRRPPCRQAGRAAGPRPPAAGAPAIQAPQPAVLASGRADAAAAAGPVLAAAAAAAVLAAGRAAAAVLAARRAAARAVLAAASAVFRRSRELVVRPETRADRGRYRGRADRRVPDRRHRRAHVPVHQVPPGRGRIPGPLGPARAEADAAARRRPRRVPAGGRGGAPRPAAARGHRRPRDAVPERPPALRL